MSKVTNRKASSPDSPLAQKNIEKESIREMIEKTRLQNSILQKMIKKIKHNPDASGL